MTFFACDFYIFFINKKRLQFRKTYHTVRHTNAYTFWVRMNAKIPDQKKQSDIFVKFMVNIFFVWYSTHGSFQQQQQQNIYLKNIPATAKNMCFAFQYVVFFVLLIALKTMRKFKVQWRNIWKMWPRGGKIWVQKL